MRIVVFHQQGAIRTITDIEHNYCTAYDVSILCRAKLLINVRILKSKIVSHDIDSTQGRINYIYSNVGANSCITEILTAESVQKANASP